MINVKKDERNEKELEEKTEYGEVVYKMHSKLIDREDLKKLYPALFTKKNRLNWLISKRTIPIVKIGNMIYFDTNDIKEWIESNKIKA